MKVQKKPKLKKIEAHITPDGDDNITKIAKNEEISVSNMIRTSIDQIFQMYPLYNAIGSLLSHGVIQRMPSPVIETCIMALQESFTKSIEAAKKSYKESEKRNPELKQMTKKTADELGNTFKEIMNKIETLQFKTQKPKMERPAGSLNKEPKSMKKMKHFVLYSMEPIEKIEKKLTKTKKETKP